MIVVATAVIQLSSVTVKFTAKQISSRSGNNSPYRSEKFILETLHPKPNLNDMTNHDPKIPSYLDICAVSNAEWTTLETTSFDA